MRAQPFKTQSEKKAKKNYTWRGLNLGQDALCMVVLSVNHRTAKWEMTIVKSGVIFLIVKCILNAHNGARQYFFVALMQTLLLETTTSRYVRISIWF